MYSTMKEGGNYGDENGSNINDSEKADNENTDTQDDDISLIGDGPEFEAMTAASNNDPFSKFISQKTSSSLNFEFQLHMYSSRFPRHAGGFHFKRQAVFPMRGQAKMRFKD